MADATSNLFEEVANKVRIQVNILYLNIFDVPFVCKSHCESTIIQHTTCPQRHVRVILDTYGDI